MMGSGRLKTLRWAGAGAVVVMVVAALVLWACLRTPHPASPGSPSATPSSPTVVAIYEDVHWYPACATSPITVGGTVFFPWPLTSPPIDETRYPMPPLHSGTTAGGGGTRVPGVMPPGPGDDIGTLIVYSNGMARFVSDSGKTAWLTTTEQRYDYVC